MRYRCRLSRNVLLVPLVLLVSGAVAACGGTYHRVTLMNATTRPIEETFIYPMGAAAHGASKGAIEPGGSLQVEVEQGNVDVLAVSAKVKLDATTNERRSASGTLELKAPMEVVFYDSSSVPPGDGPGQLAVPFHADAE